MGSGTSPGNLSGELNVRIVVSRETCGNLGVIMSWRYAEGSTPPGPPEGILLINKIISPGPELESTSGR